MYKLKMNGKNFMVFSMGVAVMLSLAIALPVSAQQPQGQQRQGGLNLTAAPGLPANCTTAAYMQDGGDVIHIGRTYSATSSGVIESVVCVNNAGWLTLISPKISKTGSKDGEYGGQAVEATEGSVVNLLDAEIYTDTNGANGLWATNEGSLIYMKGGSITTIEGSAHGVDVTKRGSVILDDVKISTSGQGASGALVNDSGDGTVYATRVTAHTKGPGSSGFYMIGSMSMLIVKDSTLEAETSEAGVLVHGSNVAITNSTLVGGKAGIKVSGGTLTITGGSLTVTNGDAFYIGGGEGGVPSGGVSGGQGGARGGGMPGGGMPQGGMPEGGMPAGGMPEGSMRGEGMPEGGMPGGEAMMGGLMPFQRDTNNTITISRGTKISSSTDVLIRHVDSSECTFTVDSTDLRGDIIGSEEGALIVSLSNSTLTGTVEGAAITLGRDSKWNVTGDSVLTSLSNASGISGKTITNIYGNGHTVYYDKKLTENKALGGKTYNLENGGKLTPKK